MPWFVLDIDTICKYVCLCDPAVDRGKLTTEEEEDYRRSPTPSVLPSVEGMTPHVFEVHALPTDTMMRMRAEMIGAVGQEPSEDDPDLDAKMRARMQRSMEAAWRLDLDTVRHGVKDCPPGVESWKEEVVEELAGLIRSLSSGDTVLRGN